MKTNKIAFVELTKDELATIEGGVNPVRYAKHAVHEFTKGFKRGW